MKGVMASFRGSLPLTFWTGASMQPEILALRHQLSVYRRSHVKPRVKPADLLVWAWPSRVWSGWRGPLMSVQPRTIIVWQPKRFGDYRAGLSGKTKPGRPSTSAKIRQLIRRMSRANPTWGPPRIVGELRKLGIDVAQSTVEKYMVRQWKPPSPTWRAFLENHAKDLVSIDFFVAPTVRFRVLFVLVVLAHHRRRVVHFGVTEHPTPESGRLSRS
jgi:putative transposase